MKTINELLNEKKTYQERLEELEKLVPEKKDNEKIYYNENKYIYFSNEMLYSGMDNYPKDSQVIGGFPFIFFLEALYLGKDFAEKYKSIPELNSNKSLKLNKYGLVELRNYGVVGNRYIVSELLKDIKNEEAESLEESEEIKKEKETVAS